MKNTKLVGVHNNIKYFICEDDGVDFYYSPVTKKTAMSCRGFARMLNCQHNLITSVGGRLGLLKEAQLLTQQGIQGVRFVTEDDIVELLTTIQKSRAKKETKNRAADVMSKYAQAGFRLQMLLEVAPEIIAQEAIAKIDNLEDLNKVGNKVELQGKYLKSYHGVLDELKEHDCTSIHYAGYNKKVNEEVGLPCGSRPKMTDKQRLEMTFMQIAGELALSNDEEVKKWSAVDLAVDVGKTALKATKNKKLKD